MEEDAEENNNIGTKEENQEEGCGQEYLVP